VNVPAFSGSRNPSGYRKYSDIEAAVRRLPILHEQTCYVTHLVDYLALMGIIIDEIGGDDALPFYFRPATAEMVKRELGELEKRANDLANKIERGGRTKRAREQLARHIREMQGPTITALSDAPAVVYGGQQMLADTWYLETGLPEKLEAGEEVAITELRFWALIAKLAKDVPLKPRSVGRLPNKRVHNIANTLARGYLNLTGNKPTFSVVVGKEGEGTVYGPFLDFVREVFQLLDIKRDALSYASTAAYKLRGSGRKTAEVSLF
jgi:hypothetical protein